MSTNPNNAVGTNAAYDGRTSVNAFNDDLTVYTRGILSGWNCQVDSGLTVMLGGSAYTRDVAVAEDNAGNKTTINNISQDEVYVTLDSAPGSNSRIDLVVAYVDNPPQGTSTVADNPSACGIINVTGTPSATPIEPDDNAIRSAITADGASGTTAYYAILAKITVPTGTTDLIPGYIEQGDKAQLPNDFIKSNNIDFTTLPGNYSTSEQNTGYTWIDGKTIYKKTLTIQSFPNNTETNLGNLLPAGIEIIKFEGAATAGSGVLGIGYARPISSGNIVSVRADRSTGDVFVSSGFDARNYSGNVTFYYTKSSS